MFRKTTVGLVLFLFSCFNIFAQKEANIWYFGNNAGLDFNSGVPVALTNGVLYTNEGCATISDTNGQLLFYTNGTTVWNKNHSIMPNGTGLLGHYSSTQSAVIVPMPGNNLLYYIFTTDQGGYWGLNKGVNYSIVDMSLNGGLGDVTTKNILLLVPAVEKITAVKHCNDSAVWVIVHDWNNNNFYSYLVTTSGVSAPVISSTGVIHQNSGSGFFETIGYLKASPNGKKLAAAIFFNPNIVEIFDFDNATGIVSNPITIPANFPVDFYHGTYGVCFSPQSTKLYVTLYPDSLYQFDLLAGNPASIINSKQLIATSNGSKFGALQLGPDKKIYIATIDTTLDVINNPDAAGSSCNYVANSINLAGRFCFFGLPDFIESLFYDSSSANFNFIASGCTDFLVQFYEQSTLLCDSSFIFIWDFGDGSSIDTLYNPVHQYSTAGTFPVTMRIVSANVNSAITKQVSVNSIRVIDFDYEQVCVGTSTLFTDTIPCNPVSLHWDFGDGQTADNVNDPAHLFNASGTYIAELSATWSDGRTDSINKTIIVLQDTGNADFYYYYSGCTQGITYFFDSSLGNPISWKWDFRDGDTSSLKNPNHSFVTNDTFLVSLMISYTNTCQNDTVTKLFYHSFKTSLTLPDSICNNSALTANFNGNTSDINYVFWDFGDGSLLFWEIFQSPWNDSLLHPSHIFDTLGTYPIFIAIEYNTWSCFEQVYDTITIVPPVKATFNISDTSICINDTVSFVNLSSNSIKGLNWNFGDGSSLNFDQNSSHSYSINDTFTVTLIADGVGCDDTATQSIIVLPLPSVNLGNDTTVCKGDSLTLNAGEGVSFQWYPSLYLSDFTVASPVTLPDDSITYSVLVTDTNSCQNTDSVAINVIIQFTKAQITKILSNICKGETAQINYFASGDSINWQHNGKGDLIIINDSIVNYTVVPSDSENIIFVLSSYGFDRFCESTYDTIIITTCETFKIPNVFTPNNDNINDYFYINGLEDKSCPIQIFNRWGQKVFYSSNYQNNWDGGELGSDTYFYILNCIENKYKGWVRIIR